MLQIPLDELDEDALLKLGRDATEESVRLEFKRQLNVGTKDDKRELAKDISALANAAGGRIVFGIEERPLPDGGAAAGMIVPLTDAADVQTVENIIADCIQPRPRFRHRQVPVSGGFVLIVEVYPSTGLDLHMVSAWGESRFFKRGERRTIVMTEPEVREAYTRIAISRSALERTLERSVAAEKTKRRTSNESILVVPWFSRPGLVDPRRLADLPGQLAALPALAGLRDLATSLKIMGDGFRAVLPHGSNEGDANFYLAIKKDGVIHLSVNHVYIQPLRYFPMGLVRDLFRALTVAQLVLDRCAYWGPVRVTHVLRAPPEGLTLFLGPRVFTPPRLPAGELEHGIAEINLQQVGTELEPLIGDVLDQLFQHSGSARCPLFNASGKLLPELRGELEQWLAQ